MRIKYQTINKKYCTRFFIITIISLNLIRCQQPSKPTQQQIEEQTTITKTYSNRELTLQSIDDTTWLSKYADQIETDTFLYRQFFKKSLTLLQNKHQGLPIRQLKNKQFDVVYWGDFPTIFMERLAYYCRFDFSSIDKFAWNDLSENNQVFLVINQKAISKSDIELIKKIHSYQNQVIIINLETIQNLSYLSDFPTIVQVYESNAVTQDWIAQLLFGGIQAEGKLPVSINNHFPKGIKNATTPVIRLSYNLPEAADMNSNKLKDIDRIMARAIRKKAIPGGQIMAIKSGKVIYYQSFGYFTYDKKKPVHNLNLYDVASITKTAATTLAVMKLYEEGLLDTEKRLKNYIERGRFPSRNLKIRHLLTHRSGLPSNPFISKYVRIQDTTSAAYQSYFSTHRSDLFSVEITENLFMNESVQNEVWNAIYKTRSLRNRDYLYSDVNFALLQNVTEVISGKSMDTYLNTQVYQPLGLNYLRFRPLEAFEKSMIVPSVLDTKWRHTILQGEVHDELAALFGGVGGNAGLFSNANDLAILHQMLLNNGYYGGEQIFDKSTIDHFIYKKHTGHRGLGFDKKGAGCYKGASRQTFGHSGYTGTCVWVDAEQELIYIFLSNRVYPNPKNDKLMELNTRAKIHKVFYKAI